ncbi:MAG: hypothetical protein R3B95_14320 [Nitrospirales bacterium]|nr:hypothetical protein [Nitrospirales bacterium]
MYRFLGLLIITLSVLGCSTLGNVVVPPHPNSDLREKEKVCIYQSLEAQKKAIPAIVAAAGVGLLVDRIAEGIKEEAGRYKTSYSGRKTFRLFLDSPGKEMNPAIDTFELVRWVGKEMQNKSCKEIEALFSPEEKLSPKTKNHLLRIKKDEKDQTVIEETIRVGFKFSAINQPIWEVTGDYLLLGKTKAKVSQPKIWAPWTWWLYLSDSAGKIDLSATLAIGGVITTKDGVKHSEFLKTDMPLAKNVDLHDVDEEPNQIGIKDVTSGYFVIPASNKGSQDEKDRVPMTLSLTINESDDIGDLIAKGSKKVSENKQQIINFSLEKFGLPPGDTSTSKGDGDGGGATTSSPQKNN